MNHPHGETREPRPGGGRAFGALRHRDFTLLWSGSLIFHISNWMRQIAQGWLLYELTGSPFLVGLNGLVHTVPFMGMSLYAGTLVDRVDRRRLLIAVETVQLILIVLLATLVCTGTVEVWHIYATGFFSSLVGAFEIPAQQSLVPYLVPREDLMTAISLNSLVRRGTQIVGPSLGGLSIAAFQGNEMFHHPGVAETFIVNAVGYVALLGALIALRTSNPPTERSTTKPLQAMIDGIQYVRGESIISSLLMLEAVLSVFGSFNAMLVVFARDVFETGPQGLGLLQSAPGIGTVVGSVALSAIGDVRHKGRLIVVGGTIYGAAVIAFALCGWFPLALVLLACAGAADIVVGATRNTILQLTARGPMMGRVMALHAMSTRGLGPVGGFQAGSLGSLIGVPHAVLIGGIICTVATIAVATLVPGIREWTDDHSSAEPVEGGRGRGRDPAVVGSPSLRAPSLHDGEG